MSRKKARCVKGLDAEAPAGYHYEAGSTGSND